MPTWKFTARTAAELDQQLRVNVLALDNLGRSDEVYGTIEVTYSEDTVKTASLVSKLEQRGMVFRWKKI